MRILLPPAPLGAVTQHYLDPGEEVYEQRPSRIRLGRTGATGAWIVDTASRVNTASNVISRQGLNYIDRFTGLTNGQVSDPSNGNPPKDTSNKGTRFWVGYGHNNNVQTFVTKMGGADHDAQRHHQSERHFVGCATTMACQYLHE